jgi:hypothetical protein
MSFSQAPLWQQLLMLWSVALLLCGILLWVESRRTFKFFWLVPYPSLRALGRVVMELFRIRPLLATAIFGIPAATFLGTVALCAIRLAGRAG